MMRRVSESGLRAATAVGLTAVGLAILTTMWVNGSFVVAGATFAIVPIAAAILLMTGAGWTTILAAMVAVIYCWIGLAAVPVMVRLWNLEYLVPFLAHLVWTASSAIATITAIASIVLRSRASRPRA